MRIAVDCRNVDFSLSNARDPNDKPILSCFWFIRHYFAGKEMNQMIWIPGSTNIAGVIYKMDGEISNILLDVIHSEMMKILTTRLKSPSSQIANTVLPTSFSEERYCETFVVLTYFRHANLRCN